MGGKEGAYLSTNSKNRPGWKAGTSIHTRKCCQTETLGGPVSLEETGVFRPEQNQPRLGPLRIKNRGHNDGGASTAHQYGRPQFRHAKENIEWGKRSKRDSNIDKGNAEAKSLVLA